MKKYLSSIVFACILLAGLLVFDQYGESWDDRSLQKYAALSLRAYTTWPQQGFIEVTPQDLGYYGPFFVMLVALVSQYLSTLLPTLLPDLRHLIYFLTSFAGLVAFYSLARRWLSQIPAIGATLLLVTQPILWGHIFINPKDTPFLALFMISLVMGFKMIDSVHEISLQPLEPSPKRTLALLSALWLVSVFSLFIFTDGIHSYISTLVNSAVAGNTNIITYIASKLGQVSAEVYIQRYFLLFLKFRAFYFLLFTLILLFTWYRLQPNLIKILLAVLSSALLLGFTTSTRILGPFAGLIVTLYALYKNGKQSLPALGMYAVISMIAVYLTWPYLWPNPVIHFYSSLMEMSAYPWTWEVLFNGENYLANDLPAAYLPVLLAIQLTEPVWALAMAGWGLAIFSGEKKRELLALSAVWFLIPTILFIGLRIVLYDNFRQVLFVLPPVFLTAGIVFEKIKNIKWQTALIAVSLLPGVAGIVSLHPYEYIYYNTFIGGVEGVQGRFETDYWLTSYREAAEYVNAVAPPNAVVWVEGPGNLYSIFARTDLDVYSRSRDQSPDPYDYVVVTTRFNFDKNVYPDAEIVYKIMRDDAVLAVIKKP